MFLIDPSKVWWMVAWLRATLSNFDVARLEDALGKVCCPLGGKLFISLKSFRLHEHRVRKLHLSVYPSTDPSIRLPLIHPPPISGKVCLCTPYERQTHIRAQVPFQYEPCKHRAKYKAKSREAVSPGSRLSN